MISKIDATKKISELVEEINYHDELYYKKNYQEISDEEYDKLRRELLELEKNFPEIKLINSPNKSIGKIDNNQFYRYIWSNQVKNFDEFVDLIIDSCNR